MVRTGQQETNGVQLPWFTAWVHYRQSPGCETTSTQSLQHSLASAGCAAWGAVLRYAGNTHLETDFLGGPGFGTLSILCKCHLKLLILWLSDVIVRPKDIFI